MPRNSKIFLILAVIIGVFVAGIHTAWAQTPPQPVECGGNASDDTVRVPGTTDANGATVPPLPTDPFQLNWNGVVLEDVTSQIQNMAQAQFGFQDQVQHTDLQNMYCLNNIGNIFTLISTLSSSSNANIFSEIGAAIATAIENQIITQIENTVCGVVTQALSGIEQSVQLKLCIPLPQIQIPKFNFGIPGIPRIPCNGTNVLSPQFLNQQPVPGAPNFYQLFNVGGQ